MRYWDTLAKAQALPQRGESWVGTLSEVEPPAMLLGRVHCACSGHERLNRSYTASGTYSAVSMCARTGGEGHHVSDGGLRMCQSLRDIVGIWSPWTQRD